MEQEALLPAPSEARIVEIGEAARSVSFAHGNIVIAGDEGLIERVPILEIAGMVVWRPGLSWSGAALAALSERGAGIVVCEPNYRSRMLSWPMSGRRWPSRIRAQMAMDAPFARHLLRSLVRARDDQREAVIEAMGKGNALKALHKAGKPTVGASRMSRDRKQADIEKQIHRHYWAWLTGPGFRRDPVKADGNAVINFAHTMLRVEAARAVHKAGLHPSIGLGGARRKGGLIDDLMLPYRPVADLAAAILIATGQREMDEGAPCDHHPPVHRADARPARRSADPHGTGGIGPVAGQMFRGWRNPAGHPSASDQGPQYDLRSDHRGQGSGIREWRPGVGMGLMPDS